jgi:endonuclease/exonuclease/phosphatase family metal-dependent hydrolase
LRLTFASYNIHKAVGLDRRRDPERILTVLHELDADVVALQEADLRFGSRAAVLPRALLEEHHWQVAALSMKPSGMAWHGNAILVRRGVVEILAAEPIALPVLEPRGAVCARLKHEGVEFKVVGMHLDLSGLLRRHQVETICKSMHQRGGPAVLMGDLNEWSVRGGALRAFDGWEVLSPGRSFPSRRPIAQLDRIVHSSEWRCEGASVHHSALAAVASDHLPVTAALSLTA